MHARQREVTSKPLQLDAGRLSSRVDLTPLMPPIKDQKQLSTCSANAFASVIEYSFKRKYQRQIQVSRLFLYYNGRREQYPDRTIQDAGTSVKHMADAIVKFGFCEEKFWPYQIDLVNQKPSHEAYQNAKKFTIVPVQTQATLKNIKTALTKGLPTMIGILLLHTAKAEAAKYGGRISTPTIVATNIMNTQKHAIVCVGYDDQQQYLIVRNSRGERWGRHGYFYLPYDYFSQPHLIDLRGGAWTLRDIHHR